MRPPEGVGEGKLSAQDGVESRTRTLSISASTSAANADWESEGSHGTIPTWWHVLGPWHLPPWRLAVPPRRAECWQPSAPIHIDAAAGWLHFFYFTS